jgi:hypothetical protein
MQALPPFVIVLTLLSSPFATIAQQNTTQRSSIATEEMPLSPAEEAESYDIYSTLLQVTAPAVANWAIVRETRGFQMCLEPAGDQESIYRPMIDDYALKNKKTMVLQRKFKLSAYTLAGPEAWTSAPSSSRNAPTVTEHRTVAVLSAVGFNRDRTRALICFWANTSGACHFMAKQESKWQIDRSWRGSACGWAN